MELGVLLSHAKGSLECGYRKGTISASFSSSLPHYNPRRHADSIRWTVLS